MKHEFVVEEDFHGWRLDKYLPDHLPQYSRSEIQNNITGNRCLVNGQIITKKGFVLSTNDQVSIEIPQIVELSGKPQDIPMDIRYEDQWLMVVNKPVGMVVHPAPGNYQDTLVNALLGYGASLSDLGGEFRPGIVHRLDKETSGLLVIAKTNAVHRRLTDMLKERVIKRTYLTLVDGAMPQAKGRIQGAIGRHPRNRIKMAVVEQGKPAITDFKVLRFFSGHTLVQASLQTGRTHQIRVHFSHLGCPVTGDTVYGRIGQIKYAGHMLHARTLGFTHPVTQEDISITAEPPKNFLKIIRDLWAGEALQR